MNEIEARKEIFQLDIGSELKLKPIKGFTENKEYQIVNEIPEENYMKGMLYTVIDDDGNQRHINSNYFRLPEVELDVPEGTSVRNNNEIFQVKCRGKAESVKQIDNLFYENLVNVDVPVVRTKTQDRNDLGFAKVISLEEKIKKSIPEEPNLEMKILCGLRKIDDDRKNSFDIMREAIDSLEKQIQSLQTIKEKMNLEIEMLKRISVLS